MDQFEPKIVGFFCNWCSYAAADLPDNLEELARFEKDKLGVNMASCGTFHVIDGFAKTVDDKSNIDDFVVPVKLPQAAEAVFGADKILYY